MDWCKKLKNRKKKGENGRVGRSTKEIAISILNIECRSELSIAIIAQTIGVDLKNAIISKACYWHSISLLCWQFFLLFFEYMRNHSEYEYWVCCVRYFCVVHKIILFSVASLAWIIKFYQLCKAVFLEICSPKCQIQ